MHMTDLIEKKKQGQTLTQEELHFIVHGYTAGDIPDYQMSALMMAIYFRGMTPEETAQLTIEMEHSGDVVDLSPLGEHTADKHSTGGVGDKTSLVLCPMVAACGGKMAKMSGRGLGHTGGTIDKLESFPGFSTAMTPEKFLENAENVGFVIAGQTANLAPADKKMYALRDVTATVDSIPLIVSSIMGKKLASGARTIVLDVKTGSGAFMETEESAFELARQMVSVGKHAGRNMAAVVTDMDQPLGFAVGNALEVKEAISVLRGADVPLSSSTPWKIAVRPETLISAPMRCNWLKCLKRSSKIFSSTVLVPCATHNRADKGCCKSVGKPGYGCERTAQCRGRFCMETRMQSSPSSTCTPISSNFAEMESICMGITFCINTSPRVAAAATMSVPVSI